MTRKLRIVLASAVALMVISTGGFVALLLTLLAPQSAGSSINSIGGPFTLTASDGRTVTDQTYRGKWVLIYFGYTSCPDACPTALNDMGLALERLGTEAAGLQPVFITVDPKRDTRDMLAEYLKSFDPHVIGLTGGVDQIAATVKEYHVYVSAHPASDGNYTVDHSNFFYLLNPTGKFVNVIPGDLSDEGIATRIGHFMSKTG